MSDEIQPYVVYRIEGDQMECALWQFKDGQKALALFLSGDAATSYRVSANLGAEWKIFCPAKEALLQMLKGCHEAGMGYAVLDPDLEKAIRICNIHQMKWSKHTLSSTTEAGVNFILETKTTPFTNTSLRP